MKRVEYDHTTGTAGQVLVNPETPLATLHFLDNGSTRPRQTPRVRRRAFVVKLAKILAKALLPARLDPGNVAYCISV